MPQCGWFKTNEQTKIFPNWMKPVHKDYMLQDSIFISNYYKRQLYKDRKKITDSMWLGVGAGTDCRQTWGNWGDANVFSLYCNDDYIIW